MRCFASSDYTCTAHDANSSSRGSQMVICMCATCTRIVCRLAQSSFHALNLTLNYTMFRSRTSMCTVECMYMYVSVCRSMHVCESDVCVCDTAVFLKQKQGSM